MHLWRVRFPCGPPSCGHSVMVAREIVALSVRIQIPLATPIRGRSFCRVLRDTKTRLHRVVAERRGRGLQILLRGFKSRPPFHASIDLYGGGTGCSPVVVRPARFDSLYWHHFASVAQVVERETEDLGVGGASPPGGTIYFI